MSDSEEKSRKYRAHLIEESDFSTAMELAQSAVVWLEQRCEDIECPAIVALLMLEMYIPTYIDIHASLPRHIILDIAKKSGRSVEEIDIEQKKVIKELRGFITEAGEHSKKAMEAARRTRNA